MFMAEEFEILTAKVLSGEASESELARFREILAADAGRRAEFEELRESWARLKELAPLADALNARPVEPPLDMRKQWLERVERKYGQGPRKERRLAVIGLALAALIIASAIVGALFLRDSGKSRGSSTSPTASESSLLQAALTNPPEQLRSLLVTTRDAKAISVYSPVGFTADSTPTIMWKALPGKTYVVAITDELNPASSPLLSMGAVSPLAFTNAWEGRTLSPDGLYRLRISENGKPLTATELTFRILSLTNVTIPSQPAAKLIAAQQMLAANPSRISDALVILLTLPPDLANSDRALRLKLFAFGQLGYAEDFETTFAQLQSGK
jgi:hypothetical protein